MVCQGIPSLCQNDKNEEGIAHWLVFGRSLATMANSWGPVSQTAGAVVAGMLMALFMALETMIVFFGSIKGLVAGVALVGAAKKMVGVNGEKKKLA